MSLKQLAFRAYQVAWAAVRLVGLGSPVRKVLGPLVGRIFFKASRPILVNGHRMILAPEGRFPPAAMVMGKYEPETTRIMERVITSEMVVLDVGAHVGYFSLLAAKAVGPGGHVYSFEPEPENFRLLNKNATLNGYSQIETINRAVSSSEGGASLFLTALDTGRHSLYDHDLPGHNVVEIQTTTLDRFLEDHDWPSIGMLKIDVEGSEFDVFQGMKQMLERSCPSFIVVEYNPILVKKTGGDVLEFLNLPESWGFQVEVIDEANGLIPLKPYGRLAFAENMLKKEETVNLLWSRR